MFKLCFVYKSICVWIEIYHHTSFQKHKLHLLICLSFPADKWALNEMLYKEIWRYRWCLHSLYWFTSMLGINPHLLRGQKIGVFIGAECSESENAWFYEKLQRNGFCITGCSRAMLANRISYWLGINGK